QGASWKNFCSASTRATRGRWRFPLRHSSPSRCSPRGFPRDAPRAWIPRARCAASKSAPLLFARRKLEPEAEAGSDGKPELLDRSCGGGVFLVEEVFDADEAVDSSAERARSKHVENEEAVHREHVLIVVILQSHHAAFGGK